MTVVEKLVIIQKFRREQAAQGVSSEQAKIIFWKPETDSKCTCVFDRSSKLSDKGR